MPQFIEIPVSRLQEDVLLALLEEFASRDGTDYGERETDMGSRVDQLRCKLNAGDMALLYDSDSEQWDVLPRDRVAEFLED